MKNFQQKIADMVYEKTKEVSDFQIENFQETHYGSETEFQTAFFRLNGGGTVYSHVLFETSYATEEEVEGLANEIFEEIMWEIRKNAEGLPNYMEGEED